MASKSNAAFLLLASAILCVQITLSSGLTEEARLRAAIADSSVTSFELTSDIRLTQNLPPIKLASGKKRTLRIFSKGGFTISGIKKYRGFWTADDTFSRDYPVAALTFDNIKLINMQVKNARGRSFGSVGLNGAAIGVEKTSVTVINSVISGCRADGTGGAIYIFDGALTVTKSQITNNRASIGGGIDISAYGKALTVTDSVFSGNKVYGQSPFGGAINVQLSAIVKITRTTFKANSAYSGGAFRAIFNSNEQPKTAIYFDSCTFDSNVAGGSLPDDGSDDGVLAQGGGAIELNSVKAIRFNKPNFVNNFSQGPAKNIYIIQGEGEKTKISISKGDIFFRYIDANRDNSYDVVYVK